MPQRVRQTIYSLPKKRPKTGKKIANSVKHHEWLLERQKTEGDTTWLRNALQLNEVKLHKFGVKDIPGGSTRHMKAKPKLKKAASRTTS